MLVCYLDDSGTDPQNSIVTVAGYAATVGGWAAFEIEVEPIFEAYGVAVLHATDLEGTRGAFKGWSVLKKQSFVARLCLIMSRHVTMGVSMSVAKKAYGERAAESGRKRTVTAYTFCSNVIIDWLLRDRRVGRVANTQGLSLRIEAGSAHNAEAELNFREVRTLHGLEGVLHSISFVPKGSCRAIQMADLFAFYSRRHGVEMELAPAASRPLVQASPGRMLNIITERTPHRAFIATDFGLKAPGSRFIAGDLASG